MIASPASLDHRSATQWSADAGNGPGSGSTARTTSWTRATTSTCGARGRTGRLRGSERRRGRRGFLERSPAASVASPATPVARSATKRAFYARAKDFDPSGAFFCNPVTGGPLARGGKVFQSPRKENPSPRKENPSPGGKEEQNWGKENPNCFLLRIKPFQRVQPTPSQIILRRFRLLKKLPRDRFRRATGMRRRSSSPVSPSPPSVFGAIGGLPLIWNSIVTLMVSESQDFVEASYRVRCRAASLQIAYSNPCRHGCPADRGLARTARRSRRVAERSGRAISRRPVSSASIEIGIGEAPAQRWQRRWNLELIERFNPNWRDLYETLNN